MLISLLCGCTENTVMPGLPREIEVSLNLTTVPSASATKASMDITAHENCGVRNLWVLQFDGMDGNPSLLSARYYANYTDDVKVKLIVSDAPNRLLFVANTNNPSIEFSKCRTLNDVKRLSKFVTDDMGALGEYYSGDYYVLMNGHADAVINGSALSLDVPMKRNAVRLDVKIKNSTGGTVNPVTIDSVRICKAVKDIYYFTDYELPAAYPSKEQVRYTTYPATMWADGQEDGGARNFTFYCPANKRGSITNSDPKNKLLLAPDGFTWLQVAGTDSQGQPVSYRFCLGGDQTENIDLLPNTDYGYEFEITGAGDYTADSRVENVNMQDFTSAPLANSYMIQPPTLGGVWKHVRIPVRRVYDFWNVTDGYEKVSGNALGAGSFGWQAEIIRSTVELVEDVNFKWIKRTGTDYQDYFEYAITEGMEGNFVIGVHRFTDAGRTLLDDVFLWSWHMWVTDYNPGATLPILTPQIDGNGDETQWAYNVVGGQVNRFSGNIWKGTGALAAEFMMDRNLGALSQTERHGPGTLYYQWGRKDPFMYASSMNQAPTKGVDIYNRYNDALVFPFKTKAQLESENGLTDLVRYSIYHPDTYILIPEWTNSDVDDYAQLAYIRAGNWRDTKLGPSSNANLLAKSIFDPCPAGWRVPQQGSMTFPGGTVTETVNNISISTLPNGAVIYRPNVGQSAFGGPANTYTYANTLNYWTNRVPNGGSQPYIMIGNTNNAGVLYPVRCVSYAEP